MPYIDKRLREIINFRISDRDPVSGEVDENECISFRPPVSPGELNYVLSKIIHEYLDEPSYSDYNEVVGVLECCKLELYRKHIGIYEDQKEFENGSLNE